MVRKVRFDSAFTLCILSRSGTKAASLDHHLPLEVRRQRLLTLNELQYSIALEINQSLVGSTQEVLVEGWSKPTKASSAPHGPIALLYFLTRNLNWKDNKC